MKFFASNAHAKKITADNYDTGKYAR